MISIEIPWTRLPLIDKLGAGLSMACGVHCLATPLLVMLTPLGLLGERYHTAFILGTILLAATTFAWGYRCHKRAELLPLLLAALAAFGAGLAFEGQVWEHLFMILGAALLIAGHVRNGMGRPHEACQPASQKAAG